MQRFVWEINFTQNLDLFGETLFFYPVANTFSQTGCQIPYAIYKVVLEKIIPIKSPFQAEIVILSSKAMAFIDFQTVIKARCNGKKTYFNLSLFECDL